MTLETNKRELLQPNFVLSFHKNVKQINVYLIKTL